MPRLHPGIAGIEPDIREARLHLEAHRVAADSFFEATEMGHDVSQVVPGLAQLRSQLHRPSEGCLRLLVVTARVVEVADIEPALGGGPIGRERPFVVTEGLLVEAPDLGYVGQATPRRSQLRLDVDSLFPKFHRFVHAPGGEELQAPVEKDQGVERFTLFRARWLLDTGHRGAGTEAEVRPALGRPVMPFIHAASPLAGTLGSSHAALERTPRPPR